MKKIIKSIFKNKLFKTLIILLIGLLVIKECYSIYIDRYNFQQFEKAKVILDNIPADADKFYTLKEFNSIYKTNIIPIKNCYKISNDNGNETYIFAFKFDSLFYKIKYFDLYYIYPKYDAPITISCIQGEGCIDIRKKGFYKTISNPCED